MKTRSPGHAPAAKSSTLMTQTLLFLAALACFAAGFYAVGWDSDYARSVFRLSTLILLCVSGTLMLAFAIRARRTPLKAGAMKKIGWGSWIRVLFIGLAWSYFAALVAGSQPGVAYIFLAAMASWTCAFCWLWIAAPAAGSIAAAFSKRWWIRLPIAGVFWALVSLFIAEAGLRLFAACQGRTAFDRDRSTEFTEATFEFNTAEALLDEAPTELPTSMPPLLRIAVLGGPTNFDAAQLTSQLGPLVPGIEVRHFASPTGSLIGYRRGISAAVEAYQPRLLLVFLAIEDDLTYSDSAVSPFDWHALQIVQALAAAIGNRVSSASSDTVDSKHGTNRYRQFLESCSLSVCRKPLTESVLHCWNATLAELDELAEHCQKSSTTLGIVLVPAEFQLDPVTLEALCRCAGCTTQEIDLDLPQRRIEAYAAGHHLSCIDLLPYLRASKSLPYCRHSRQWNETGNAIVANAVSQFVLTRYGNQMAASSASR